MVGPMGKSERVSPSSGTPHLNTAPGILCLASSTILTPLIDVYYLSHAFPRQMNHQQRKPTRPPTTTTAATEIPAIAPVERLVLADTQVSPSRLKPEVHSEHVGFVAPEGRVHLAQLGMPASVSPHETHFPAPSATTRRKCVPAVQDVHLSAVLSAQVRQFAAQGEHTFRLLDAPPLSFLKKPGPQSVTHVVAPSTVLR